ncbi:tripartite tricarboxylate transporter permease [Chelativorans sp. M5D2P16]|uniref:tripartite tricarboxylate transporter permease n=1 Tax=Chelativorans sp. M5D2P16 TaxID=3095678 RepID=UPI002AC9FA4E|nr:tripartite tricarboxylate transporter permease [Chelativorans sp. M5D2P16]MDZ5696576.1 tripartite tricarboxylate transporter permease [Chelativorans sp. M5D2P16]
MDVMLRALVLLADPVVITAMVLAAIYGLAVGSVPGLTASMAVALIIPITYFLDPVPALAGVMTLSAMAIFAGDLPGALLRIPGTPASAAYADEAYRMTQQGRASQALGVGLVCSAVGGVFGAILLITAAPWLARIALQFSSYEKFWLACLGLTAAAAVSQGHWTKGALSLLLGLAIAQVGLDPVSGQMRFTFGFSALSAGLSFIPVLIGFFAIPELLRYALGAGRNGAQVAAAAVGLFHGLWTDLKRLRWGIARGSAIGAVIGAIPGAGADIAAYVSYALSKRLSRHPEKFGTGITDGIASASASNNSSIGGALIPATVFGIPGDSLTAIIIGVLFMKGLNPGPNVFLMNADLINAVFLSYLIANILIVPFGFAAIAGYRYVLKVPKSVLMPAILAFCIVGAFAVDNTMFAVLTMLMMGIIAYALEEGGYPLAPAILGLVIGPMLEETFLTSLTRARGELLAFVERPVAGGLAAVTIILWLSPLIVFLIRLIRNRKDAQRDRGGQSRA